MFEAAAYGHVRICITYRPTEEACVVARYIILTIFRFGFTAFFCSSVCVFYKLKATNVLHGYAVHFR